jgi:hypothetical protein
MGIFEDDVSFEWAFSSPSFTIPKKLLGDRYYLDDLLIITNSSFNYHLLNLEVISARLSTNEFLVLE